MGGELHETYLREMGVTGFQTELCGLHTEEDLLKLK